MSNPDFNAILNRSSSDVERPQPIPIGPYLFGIKGLPKYDKSSKKGTPYVEFTCAPKQAGEEVDEEALTQALTKKDGTKKLLVDQVQRLTFYLTEDALFRLKEFLLKDLKLADEDTDLTLTALIDQAPNSEFIGVIKHTPTNDGKGVFANIGSTMPVE